MVAVHPYKGGHNAVCDMEVLIPFSQIKYLTQNFFSISYTAAYCIFPEIFEVFSFSQVETSKKFSFGLSFWLMVRVMKEDFFLSTKPEKRKHRNSGRVFFCVQYRIYFHSGFLAQSF